MHSKYGVRMDNSLKSYRNFFQSFNFFERSFNQINIKAKIKTIVLYSLYWNSDRIRTEYGQWKILKKKKHRGGGGGISSKDLRPSKLQIL